METGTETLLNATMVMSVGTGLATSWAFRHVDGASHDSLYIS